MTVKERLHEKIDAMTQEEAELLLDWLTAEEDFGFEPLSRTDRERIERSMAQLHRGERIPHEQVMRELGILD